MTRGDMNVATRTRRDVAKPRDRTAVQVLDDDDDDVEELQDIKVRVVYVEEECVR